jgi:hypothetical protein
MGRIECAPKTLGPSIAPQVNLLFYIYLFFFGEQKINKIKKIELIKVKNFFFAYCWLSRFACAPQFAPQTKKGAGWPPSR